MDPINKNPLYVSIYTSTMDPMAKTISINQPSWLEENSREKSFSTATGQILSTACPSLAKIGAEMTGARQALR